MKFGNLLSVAHNIGHSISSGIGLMVGIYEMDVYGDARRAPNGCIDVDFVRFRISGNPSSKTTGALAEYIEKAWPELCPKHGVDVTDFKEFSINFDQSGSYTVTVEAHDGRRSVQEFERSSGKRTTQKSRLHRRLTEYQTRRILSEFESEK